MRKKKKQQQQKKKEASVSPAEVMLRWTFHDTDVAKYKKKSSKLKHHKPLITRSNVKRLRRKHRPIKAAGIGRPLDPASQTGPHTESSFPQSIHSCDPLNTA